MAQDITVEIGVKPILNQKQFDAEMRKFEKSLRAIRFGAHPDVANRGARLIQYLMATGQAATPTQGRMIISDRMGGGFSNVAKANLRTAQNQAQVLLGKQKQESIALSRRERQELLAKERVKEKAEDLEKKAFLLQHKYEGFVVDPTQSAQKTLVDNIVLLRYETDQILKEYKKNGMTVPKSVKSIDKNLNKMSKKVSTTKVKPEKIAYGTALGSFLGNAQNLIRSFLGAAAVQKTFQIATEGIKTGDYALTQQAMYGSNRDVAFSQAMADIWGLDEKTISWIQQYALMAHQRIMTGQIGEQERLGLARMGPEISNAIYSGAAAKDPRAFFFTLYDYLKSMKGKESEALQNLQFLGAPGELMKLTTYQPSDEEIREAISRAEMATTKDVVASLNSMRTRRWWRQTGRQAESVAANVIFGQLSDDTAFNLGALTPRQRELYIANAPATALAQVQGRNPYSLPEFLKGKIIEEVPALGALQKGLSIIHNNDVKVIVEHGDAEEVEDAVRKVYDDLNNEGMMNFNNSIKAKGAAK